MTSDHDASRNCLPDPFRDAGRAVNDAARSLTPPTSQAARHRQQRRARGIVAAGAAVVALGTIGIVALRSPAPQEVAVGAGPITGEPGSTIVGVPGSTVGSVVPTYHILPIYLGDRPPFSSTGTAAPPVETTAPGTTVTAPTTSTTDLSVSPEMTTVPPTTTLTPPTPATPTTVSPTITLSGDYVGDEHYALFTERCPDISHHIDGHVQFGPEQWKYVSDYCGQNGADGMWRGSGVISLIATDGTGLSGTFQDEAKAGTRGEPFDLNVKNGTGRFTGATGTCHITVHIREIQFGEQEQTGTFTCTIST